MAKLDELKSPEPEDNVEGVFDCHFCEGEANSAFYDAGKKILSWKCGEGHTSRIEDMVL